jgi:drug/metabolite transporter (DMT)-like permease
MVTALWGLNLTALKSIAFHFHPVVMATERAAIATLFMGVVLCWRCRNGQQLNRFTARQWSLVVACAVLMVYTNQILISAGLTKTSATNGSVAVALSPLVSSLMAALILRERMDLSRLVGVALGLGGVLIVVLKTSGAQLGQAGAGDLMVVASVVTFAIGGVLIQMLARETDVLQASAVVYASGTAMLLLHAVAVDAAPDLAAWVPGFWPVVLMLFSALIATAFGNLVWNHAIAKMGMARVSLWFYWVPIFGVGFASLLLDEALSAWHGVGLVAVIAGTAIGTRRPA